MKKRSGKRFIFIAACCVTSVSADNDDSLTYSASSTKGFDGVECREFTDRGVWRQCHMYKKGLLTAGGVTGRTSGTLEERRQAMQTKRAAQRARLELNPRLRSKIELQCGEHPYLDHASVVDGKGSAHQKRFCRESH